MHKYDTRRDFDGQARLILISGLAIVVGALSTVTAWVLLRAIHFFSNLFFFQKLSTDFTSPAGHALGIWVIVVPVLGGLVIGLIARYGTEQIRGHGIPEAIEAILFKKSLMSPKVAVLKPLASAIAIGSGGPFGAEGPIIMTGGAVGSLLAQHFHLSAAERKTLLVAGAVAGMTAVFGTPVAALLLAVELLLFELRPRSLAPVAIACVIAGFLRPVLIDSGPLFPLHSAALPPSALLSCLIAGLLCGALAWLLSTSLYRVEDLFHRLPCHWMWWPAIGGLAVGIGGYFQPRALGVGYDVIADLLHNHIAAGALLALLAIKAVIWLLALGSGTSGGVLAPLLMLGAGLGALLGPYLPGSEPAIWPLVFMAATLGGMMRAPIMAVAFAFELTHDVNALLPVMAASAVAYAFTVTTMHRSILTEKIARRGYHIYREYGIDPMERHSVAEVMTPAPLSIDAGARLADVLASHFNETQRHRAFPVTRDGALVGMLDRPTLLERLPGNGDLTAGELFGVNMPVVALADETCRALATRLAVHELERLPVVSDARTLRLIGIVSRSDLVKPALGLQSEEVQRQTVRRLWPLQRQR
ncbi:H(+)/Cl(-) exchange transporter ClcA [Janthinobacterium sp. KBS0711]|uniref:chloride channel protein n=1 Tax=Janthinobacterium sp. KBS0711 TaxID=1649647 RepID=UPI000627D498|nr:chloride channel protein [Janthinobacterium sp. KBS0711]KKO63837.1 H(+)/Cl(-) exchange transporter ClcA [Janthinobacterium sp. KBS0711]TSD71532.1 chloride channel protein [Janthinobacterium sp. KBS0711]